MNYAKKLYEFEGQMLTMPEICAMVPVLPKKTVWSHLVAGRNTRRAMLTFDSAAARRRGADKGRRNGRLRSIINTAHKG